VDGLEPSGADPDRPCRAPATNPAKAVREFVLEGVSGIAQIRPDLWRGEIGYLAAISPTIRRLVLDLIDRQAVALASAISDTTDVTPEVARLQGIALAGVYRIIIDEAGRRTRKGRGPTKVARDLHPIVERMLDELDRWLSVSGAPRARVGVVHRAPGRASQIRSSP
jgi:hypothetical protein